MTISAGFHCTDGLLLCADTEITGPGKYDAVKIRRHSFPFGDYVLTGAGHFSYMGMASDIVANELFRRREEFDPQTSPTQQKAVFFDVIRKVTLRLHRNYDMTGTALIIGAHFHRTSGEIGLLHCAADAGVYWSRGDLFEGSGASTARRFANILCLEPLPASLMRSVAIFCLRQAKVGEEGCGGQTHAHIFPASGFHELWDEEGIAEIAEIGMRLCTVDARDLRLDSEKFNAKLQAFLSKIKGIRDAVARDVIIRRYTMEFLKKGDFNSLVSPGKPEPPS